MTTIQREKIARRKLSLLQLAQELGNVSKACKLVGYSRQQFYEIRRNFQLYGADGLIDQGELDAVLLNWGASAVPLQSASIPEPASSVLAIVCLAIAVGLLRSHHG